ncbi:MAG: tetratricopeptide repeat protein [Planctomycetota bacterium]
MSQWHEADHHAERAQRFYRAGQWERALEELRTALDQRPGEGEWWFGLGLTLDALERYGEAAEAYQRALGVRGEDVPGLLHLGVDLLRAGQPEAAIEALEKVNRLDPSVESAYAHRVLACTLLEDHDEAEVMFYLTRQHAGDDGRGGDRVVQASAHDYLAQSLVMRGELARARWCWREALRIDPAHPEANRRLAELHQHGGENDRARHHYQRQLRLTPDDAETLLDFADFLFDANRLAEAGDKYRRALAVDGTLAVAHRRLGELAAINGHLGAAADRYERAAQLDPALPGVGLGLAEVALRQGELDDARRHAARELEVEGQSAEQLLTLGELLHDLGDPPAAVRLLSPLIAGGDDRLFSDHATYARALRCRAAARLDVGQLAEAVEDAAHGLSLVPNDPGTLRVVVAASLRCGDLATAGRWLARAGRTVQSDAGLRRLRRRWRWAKLRRVLWRRRAD